MISGQHWGLTADPVSSGCDRCFQHSFAAFQWQLCRPRQQGFSHNSRFRCSPGSTLTTGHGWVLALLELHLVGNAFPTAKFWLVILLRLYMLIYLCSKVKPKNATNYPFFYLYWLSLVKTNTVVTLSYLQVIGLQSSVFLNLPHHCLDTESGFFIRLKKNVPAVSETTAL